MTPLAQRILNDYAKHPRHREFAQNGAKEAGVDVPKELLNAHAFDATAVHDMVPPLGLKMFEVKNGIMGDLAEKQFAFLPAPNTWIEWTLSEPSPQRQGLLLLEAGNLALGAFCVGTDKWFGAVAVLVSPLVGSDLVGQLRMPKPLVDWVSDDWLTNLARDVYPLLAIINTPRVIGRRDHKPHAGLQRKLTRSHGKANNFSLRPWTEVVLEVTPPSKDQSEHEGRLTGSKALHFCRTHLRIQNGKLVLVSAHWRGDPALGIVQTRYRLTG